MKKIVIIEDDKILREELEILLNDSGYQAEILSDFTDAAAQVRQIRPDLVLLDIILPEQTGSIFCVRSGKNRMFLSSC